jgi:hypothetical protein
MRPQLLMFDEVPEWDDLEVRVVVESDGRPFEGTARGLVTSETRAHIVARAALAAAGAAAGRKLGELTGVEISTVAGVSFAAVVVAESETAEPLIGTAPLRHFEDPAQAVIRGVFDAVNRRAIGAEVG